MNLNGSAGAEGRRRAAGAMEARRRLGAVAGLRSLARTGPPSAGGSSSAGAVAQDGERCDVCGTAIPADHRHLLHLRDRRILCSCEPCWGMRSGEDDLRPTGQRTLWLAGLDMPEDVWAAFRVPIGLAFFMVSTVTECVVSMYPSPAGATESELRFETWRELTQRNPVLETLEPDIEGLIVNRLADPPLYVIAPIDRCYALTGTVKAHWEGISGGPGVAAAVERFFTGLRTEARPA